MGLGGLAHGCMRLGKQQGWANKPLSGSTAAAFTSHERCFQTSPLAQVIMLAGVSALQKVSLHVGGRLQGLS